MVKFKWLVVLGLFLIGAQPSFADDRGKIFGIWRLVSFEVEYQATGEREHVRRKNPYGIHNLRSRGTNDGGADERGAQSTENRPGSR